MPKPLHKDFGVITLNDLQQYVLDLPLPTLAFFTLVETTAKLVDVSESYWAFSKN